MCYHYPYQLILPPAEVVVSSGSQDDDLDQMKYIQKEVHRIALHYVSKLAITSSVIAALRR